MENSLSHSNDHKNINLQTHSVWQILNNIQQNNVIFIKVILCSC